MIHPSISILVCIPSVPTFQLAWTLHPGTGPHDDSWWVIHTTHWEAGVIIWFHRRRKGGAHRSIMDLDLQYPHIDLHRTKSEEKPKQWQDLVFEKWREKNMVKSASIHEKLTKPIRKKAWHSRIAHIFLKGQSNNQNNHISKMQDFNPPGALRQWPPAQLMGRGWHPDGAPCVSSYWTERRSTSKINLNHIQETGTSMTSDNLITA